MKKEPYDNVEVPYYAFTALMALAKTIEGFLQELIDGGKLTDLEAFRADAIIALAHKMQEGELHGS